MSLSKYITVGRTIKSHLHFLANKLSIKQGIISRAPVTLDSLALMKEVLHNTMLE